MSSNELFIFFPAALKTIFEKIKDIARPYIALNPANLTLTIVIVLFIIQANLLISKRNDPLYYSNDAKSTAQFLNNTLKSTENIYQYLQINPSLAFGTHSLKNEVDKQYQYIVAHSLDGVDIPEAQKTLDSNYTTTQFGSYGLYRLKKY